MPALHQQAQFPRQGWPGQGLARGPDHQIGAALQFAIAAGQPVGGRSPLGAVSVRWGLPFAQEPQQALAQQRFC